MQNLPTFQRPLKPAKSMEPRSFTLYLSAATKDALRAVRAFSEAEAGGVSRAARINTICQRYALFAEQFSPTLSEGEWCGLMTIFAGGIDGELFNQLWRADHGLYHHVQAAHETGAAQEWSYDRKKLENALGNWSEEILFGVAEVVDRFWSSDLDDSRSPRQRLEDCGAQISP